MLRNINEILDAAVQNTLLKLRTQEPKKISIKVTGNKKALHQKGKNKVKTWKV